MIQLFDSLSQCCGCTACYSVCPKHAIEMRSEDDGYWYPIVNHDKCIDCGRCEAVCPLKHVSSGMLNDVKAAYGVKNKSSEERMRSSSGSVYIELAKYVLHRDGVVYGVKRDTHYGARHGRATSLSEARQFQGSKYVQSYKGRVFESVKRDLLANRLVLFTGTPCEVYGLNRYLSRNYDNLITVDIICHGTPSALALNTYLGELERKNKSSITELKFRDKEFGWRNQELSIRFSNGQNYHNPIWVDRLYRLFTNNYLLRSSCYACPFAIGMRSGDITIGDYWNIKNVRPKFEDELGVSSVLVNSPKGEAILEKIIDEFRWFPSTLEECTQHNLVAPSRKPEDYDAFIVDWKKRGFSFCLKKYGAMTLGERLRRFLSPVKSALVHLTGELGSKRNR